ncbi:hypothetical protein HK405_003262, partial [Cladochytrium tenue]
MPLTLAKPAVDGTSTTRRAGSRPRPRSAPVRAASSISNSSASSSGGAAMPHRGASSGSTRRSSERSLLSVSPAVSSSPSTTPAAHLPSPAALPDCIRAVIEVHDRQQSGEPEDSTWHLLDSALSQVGPAVARAANSPLRRETDVDDEPQDTSGSPRDIYVAGQLRGIKAPLISALSSERSRLSRTAMQVLEESAAALGPAFGSLAVEFFPALAKLCGRANRVFVVSATRSMKAIIRDSGIPTVLPVLAGAFQSTSKTQRSGVVECLAALLERHEGDPGDLALEPLEAVLREALKDSAGEVRAHAMSTLELFGRVFPDRLSTFVDTLDHQSRKNLRVAAAPRSEGSPSVARPRKLSSTVAGVTAMPPRRASAAATPGPAAVGVSRARSHARHRSLTECTPSPTLTEFPKAKSFAVTSPVSPRSRQETISIARRSTVPAVLPHSKVRPGLVSPPAAEPSSPDVEGPRPSAALSRAATAAARRQSGLSLSTSNGPRTRPPTKSPGTPKSPRSPGTAIRKTTAADIKSTKSPTSPGLRSAHQGPSHSSTGDVKEAATDTVETRSPETFLPESPSRSLQNQAADKPLENRHVQAAEPAIVVNVLPAAFSSPRAPVARHGSLPDVSMRGTFGSTGTVRRLSLPLVLPAAPESWPPSDWLPAEPIAVPAISGRVVVPALLLHITSPVASEPGPGPTAPPVSPLVFVSTGVASGGRPLSPPKRRIPPPSWTPTASSTASSSSPSPSPSPSNQGRRPLRSALVTPESRLSSVAGGPARAAKKTVSWSENLRTFAGSDPDSAAVRPLYPRPVSPPPVDPESLLAEAIAGGILGLWELHESAEFDRGVYDDHVPALIKCVTDGLDECTTK